MSWQLDLNKDNSQDSNEPPKFQENSSEQQASSKGLKGIKDTVHAVPQKLSQAVDDGSGNEIFNSIVDLFASGVDALSSFCNLLALRKCLADKSATKQITSCCYCISFILAGVLLLQLLIEFSLGNIFMSLEAILAAFVIDICLRKYTGSSDSADIL